MANPDHVALVRQGREAIRTWREAHRHEQLDLTAADLAEADLGGANLRATDLRGADLRATNLYRADLGETDLHEADLGGADLRATDLGGANLHAMDLRGADLGGANLSFADLGAAHLHGANLILAHLWRANLRRAHLGGAHLRGANLHEANLREAHLGGARLSGTIFSNTDLTAATGLDACSHEGPSTLDQRTLAQSGPLPRDFLQGCGLSDWEIEATKLYQSDLTDAQVTDVLYRVSELRGTFPIQYYSCFISYSSADETFARRLHADLQDQGVRCWFAPEDMKIGDRLRLRIDETIRTYDKLLLVLSEHSVASQWVEQEVETALAKERQGRTVLFPVRLDNAIMKIEGGWPALIRNTRHIGSFTRWKDHDAYQKAFARLIRDLTAEARSTGEGPA
jgi:uncharacterized protein YjbI with pentapeptide repeats